MHAFAGITIVAIAAALATEAAGQELSAADLVGVWQGVERTGDLYVQGEALFYPDGTYSRSFIVGQLASFQSGVYQVEANWVHFAPMDYEPKEYLGVPQGPPPSETWVVDFFDGASIHAAIGMTEISYRRVQ